MKTWFVTGGTPGGFGMAYAEAALAAGDHVPRARQVPALNHNPGATLPLLDKLHADASADVRRSVANHLNDISRLDALLATATAAHWMHHPAPTTPAVVRHAMRTLVKKGDPHALKLVGFHGSPEDLKVVGPQVDSARIPLHGTLDFTARVTNISGHTVSLAIDYVIHHVKANGQRVPKVFKLAKRGLAPGESADVTRRHSFRPISTRVHYPGTHAVALQVNGRPYGLAEFDLGEAGEPS
ncbi:hypothetical protein [Streptomyces broussonetiae]|uniref:hypothetical protein n=1 Tax=Streptomyces broussonetiae TaxID=2686304 RepID=UPI001E64DA2E|nr:hypothetical protein [Streptomyces broussonetiae]